MAERKPKTEISFDKSLRSLEEIVKRLEDEELPLEQALKLFAQGQQLARLCETQLRAAENEIRVLLESPQGDLREEVVRIDGVEEAGEEDGEGAGEDGGSAEPRGGSPSAREMKAERRGGAGRAAGAEDDLPF